MKIELRNNELIFSDVELKEFRRDVAAMKKAEAREYKNKFYISIAHFNTVRFVLSKKYRDELSLTSAYKSFASRFVTNKEPVTIEWTPAYCYISGGGIPFDEIIPATSYFDKKAIHSKQYGKSWSGFKHLFNPINGKFPSGLLERVITILNRNDVPYSIQNTFSYPEPYLDLHATFPFTPTADQINAVHALEKANNGIGKLPTGFGKTSYVAAELIAKKKVRALFLANQRVLTDDAKKDFEYVFQHTNEEIGMIGDGAFNPQNITVASIQTIAASLKQPSDKELEVAEYRLRLAERRLTIAESDDETKDAKKDITRFKKRVNSIEGKRQRHQDILPYLKNVDLFIVDEAQVLGTDQWNKFLKECPAPFRYTLSATPTRTDGGGIQIVAATGEVRYESSAADQIKKGRLSEFLGHFKRFDHKMERDVIKDLQMEYHQAYDVFIVRNELRNQHLCTKLIEWAKNHSVLGLVTRREHGEIIQGILKDRGIDEKYFAYVDGQTPKKERRDTIKDYRNGEFPILIGTSIFDVGFNAKNAAKMVRFNAGGSEVREPQRAGRTVRLREDESIGETYDVFDVNCPFFEGQARRRLKYLRNEFGHERVKIMPHTIEGELNIVGLREIINNMPSETDKEKGEEIIETLQFGKVNPDDVETDLNDEELEPDLQLVLDDLTTPE